MQVSTTPIYHFCASSISTSMNTASVKKQVTYRWLKYKSHYKMATSCKIYEKIQAFVSLDKLRFRLLRFE